MVEDAEIELLPKGGSRITHGGIPDFRSVAPGSPEEAELQWSDAGKQPGPATYQGRVSHFSEEPPQTIEEDADGMGLENINLPENLKNQTVHIMRITDIDQGRIENDNRHVYVAGAKVGVDTPTLEEGLQMVSKKLEQKIAAQSPTSGESQEGRTE